MKNREEKIIEIAQSIAVAAVSTKGFISNADNDLDNLTGKKAVSIATAIVNEAENNSNAKYRLLMEEIGEKITKGGDPEIDEILKRAVIIAHASGATGLSSRSVEIVAVIFRSVFKCEINQDALVDYLESELRRRP